MKAMLSPALVWVATATLERENPERQGFTLSEIIEKLNQLEKNPGPQAQTLREHIRQHCVANKKANPSKHRMLFHIENENLYRLYRSGDPFHPDRAQGKIVPQRGEVSPEYFDLLDWYESTSSVAAGNDQGDPLMALRGLGKETWDKLGGGENFIRELRQDWYGPGLPEDKPVA